MEVCREETLKRCRGLAGITLSSISRLRDQSGELVDEVRLTFLWTQWPCLRKTQPPVCKSGHALADCATLIRSLDVENSGGAAESRARCGEYAVQVTESHCSYRAYATIPEDT